jgi:predicted Zn-dependent protease with MMP-like domain
MLSNWPAGRRVAFTTALCLAVALTIAVLVQGLAATGPMRVLEVVALVVTVTLVLGGALGLAVAKLADYQSPESEEDFERLVLRSEELARDHLLEEPDFGELDPYDPHDFELLVRDALDDLPDLLIRALDHVAVVISDQGRRHGAYGLYQGDTVARDNYPDRIVIFRDTLLRDFGGDPQRLRDQVTRTVRHELAHHLGADELGVRELGL